MPSRKAWILCGCAALAGAISLWMSGEARRALGPSQSASVTSRVRSVELPESAGMVRIPGGSFVMGSPTADAADCRPAHTVRLRPFWIDRTPVTNAQFATFVEATDYVTTAERRGHSRVFDTSARRWLSVANADWRHPHGPDSSIAGRERWPVVQVSWYDAVAYARWAGKRLLSEAEYEFAARGRLVDCDYPWGRELLADGRYWSNGWQGQFPHFDLQRDGYASIAPVDAYVGNRFGLSDVLGNVLCWCADWYLEDYYDHSPLTNPGGPASGDLKVQRGGSWLSAEKHQPLAVWRRWVADPATSTNHVGFRCAGDHPPDVDNTSHLARSSAATRQ